MHEACVFSKVVRKNMKVSPNYDFLMLWSSKTQKYVLSETWRHNDSVHTMCSVEAWYMHENYALWLAAPQPAHQMVEALRLHNENYCEFNFHKKNDKRYEAQKNLDCLLSCLDLYSSCRNGGFISLVKLNNRNDPTTDFLCALPSQYSFYTEAVEKT